MTKYIPGEGDLRRVEGFAWWPVTVYYEDAKDTRWLERYTLVQSYMGAPWGWRNQRFVD